MITIHRNQWLAKKLLQTAAHVCDVSEDITMDLGQALLSLKPNSPSRRGNSILNNDATLLQLSFSAKPSGWNMRLIGDPAADRYDATERFNCAVDTLQSFLEITQSYSLQNACNLAIEHLLDDDLSIYRNGQMWLACGIETPGIAFYLDAKPPGAEAAWQMARNWIQEAVPNPQPALDIISRLEQFAIPASFGIEGTAPQNARAKIYFRLSDFISLDEWGIPLFQSTEYAQFLNLAMADFDVSTDGFVVSIGFSLATGELVDGKIDLCGCPNCLNYNVPNWLKLVKQIESIFGLAAIPLADVLNDPFNQVAFIGFGLEAATQQPRFNVYIKSNLSAFNHNIQAAADDAIDYLRGIQADDGYWTDYKLPVGSAEQWVTGYVGLALAEAGEREATLKATTWLTSQRSYEAGWGYNSITGADADSTAFALRLLQTLGLPVEEKDQDFLLSLWRDGGFATYPQDDAWGMPHLDVTPLAYLALNDSARSRLRDDVIAFLHQMRQPDGLWHGYWWRQPFYATYLALELVGELGISEADFPSAVENVNYEICDMFNLALLMGIKHLRGESVDDLLQMLLTHQAANGSWEGSSNLRVTDPDCESPWLDPLGRTYTDFNCTITTATVLRVLTRWLKDNVYDLPEHAVAT